MRRARVVEIGEGVDAFKVGDRVMSTFHPRWYGGRMNPDVFKHDYGSDTDGWLVERKAVSQEAVVAMPETLSYEEASTLPCAGLTAWEALTAGGAIRSGHTVLVQGTGGVSLFALQLAKAVGARVIATTSSASKADRLRALGADEVVNYKEEPKWGRTRARPDRRAGRGPAWWKWAGRGRLANRCARWRRAGRSFASVFWTRTVPASISSRCSGAGPRSGPSGSGTAKVCRTWRGWWRWPGSSR